MWFQYGVVCVYTLIGFGSGLQSEYTNLPPPSLKDHIYVSIHQEYATLCKYIVNILALQFSL